MDAMLNKLPSMGNLLVVKCKQDAEFKQTNIYMPFIIKAVVLKLNFSLVPLMQNKTRPHKTKVLPLNKYYL